MIPSGKSNQVFGEPEKWEFDYPWSVVQTAFWLWSMSGFQRLPLQTEVMEYDPRYISDMKLAYQIYSHQGNQSAPMRLYDQWQAFNQNPDGYKASISSLIAQDQNDAASPNQLFNSNQGRHAPQNNGRPMQRGRMVNTGGKRR